MSWASMRQVVVDKMQPRVLFVQGNTVHKEEKLKLFQHDPSAEGMVNSWAERFSDTSNLAKLGPKDRTLQA